MTEKVLLVVNLYRSHVTGHNVSHRVLLLDIEIYYESKWCSCLITKSVFICGQLLNVLNVISNHCLATGYDAVCHCYGTDVFVLSHHFIGQTRLLFVISLHIDFEHNGGVFVISKTLST